MLMISELSRLKMIISLLLSNGDKICLRPKKPDNEKIKLPVISFKSNKTKLLGKDAKILIEQGADLFSKLQMTPQGQEYLKYHPELKEVIEKW